MTTPAQAERRAAFYAALRSGEYKQTDQTLRRITEDGPKHCCLGVAMELYTASCETPDAVRHGETFRLADHEEPGSSYRFNTLSEGAAKWFGFDTADSDGRNPYLGNTETGARHSAAEWNDNENVDFTTIAALFELNFPAVADEA